MDELIVRVMRTVASASRLRILSRLMTANEMAPSKLARELKMARALLSVHLARLAFAGLVKRRRSGVWCYCCAQSPYGEGTLSGEVMAWLLGALASAQRSTSDAAARGIRRSLRTSALPAMHRHAFDAATAFTHPRRLQILRSLAAGKPLTVSTLTRDLKMSAAALGRHLAKLIRRGYVRSLPPLRGGAYELVSEGKTRLHGSLLAIVRTHWGEPRAGD